MSKAEIEDVATKATHQSFCEFFKLARRKYDHPGFGPTIKQCFPEGQSIEVTRIQTLKAPLIDIFGVYVFSPQLDRNELLCFSLDKDGLKKIVIDNREIIVERENLLDKSRGFARLSDPLTQWLMECYQDGEYQPFPKEIRERIAEFT